MYMDNYVNKVKRLIEATSSGPPIVTPYMFKIEILYLELVWKDWNRFIFLWCSGYYPKNTDRDCIF